MGIGGHILGEKKLRQLRERTGLNLDRAYRRGHECEGRIIDGGRCIHLDIDWDSGEHRIVVGRDLVHWTSCPPREC